MIPEIRKSLLASRDSEASGSVRDIGMGINQGTSAPRARCAEGTVVPGRATGSQGLGLQSGFSIYALCPGYRVSHSTRSMSSL